MALGHKRVHREDEPPLGVAPLVVEGEELIGDAFQDIRGPLIQHGATPQPAFVATCSSKTVGYPTPSVPTLIHTSTF